MKNRILLQALALVAGALSVSPTARVEIAQLANRVAKFKKDHGLEGDDVVTRSLNAVLRAAEVAPVSADAQTAQAQTAEHLEPSGEELDAQNSAAGASGNSELGTGDTGTGGNQEPGAGTSGAEGGPAGPKGTSGAEVTGEASDSGAPVNDAGGKEGEAK